MVLLGSAANLPAAAHKTSFFTPHNIIYYCHRILLKTQCVLLTHKIFHKSQKNETKKY
jgi:hypothetical protein